MGARDAEIVIERDESVTAGLDLVDAGAAYAVARNEHVIVVHLWGDVTDAVSDAWRTATQASYDRDGTPAFGFVHTTGGRSVGSLQGKMRSAAFMRRSAERMKRIALVGNVQGSFVIKSVMRVAGASNVELIPPADAARVLDAMREGRDPFARV